MTVVAYASGNQNVGQNPPADFLEAHDPFLDMAAAGFAFPQNVQIYGNGTDSQDAAPVWTYQWNILSQSEQAPAVTLSGNGLIRDPIVQNVNAWGNIRLFLIVTNQTSGESSETDPLKAPDSAFVTVRIRSANASIQKPAAGERNWDNDTNEWAAAIENLAGGGAAVHDHNIIDHGDVVDATGADLEALTSGGYANDPDAANPNAGGMLHKHLGTHVDAGTVATRGTVTLESAHLAEAINIEVMFWTGKADGTYGPRGWVPNILPSIDLLRRGQAHPGWNLNHLDFHNHAVGKTFLKEVTVMLDNGGPAQAALNAGNLDAYRFVILKGTPAQWRLDAQNVVAQLDGVPAADNQGLALNLINLNIEILKDEIVSVRCIRAPSKPPGIAQCGHGLTARLKVHRKAGSGV